MSKIEKMILKMRNNPLNWTIEDLKVLATRFEIDYNQPGTSHVTFRCKESKIKLTVPSHKPIKPVYTQSVLKLGLRKMEISTHKI